MGYQIVYKDGHIHRAAINEYKRHKGRGMIALTLIILLMLGCSQLIGWDNLKQHLLPGDPEVTETAFAGMLENIRTGETVKDAITAFCVEIIENAK